MNVNRGRRLSLLHSAFVGNWVVCVCVCACVCVFADHSLISDRRRAALYARVVAFLSISITTVHHCSYKAESKEVMSTMQHITGALKSIRKAREQLAVTDCPLCVFSGVWCVSHAVHLKKKDEKSKKRADLLVDNEESRRSTRRRRVTARKFWKLKVKVCDLRGACWTTETAAAAGRRADVIIKLALMSMHGMYWAAAEAGDVVTNASQHRLTIISFSISSPNFFI